MKKLICITLMMLLTASMVTIVSCSKDNGTANNTNTVVNNDNNSSGGLKFLSQTQVTVIDWESTNSGVYEEDVEESGTYEYTAPDGQLHLTSGDYNFFINDNTLQLFNYDGYTQIIMTRQL